MPKKNGAKHYFIKWYNVFNYIEYPNPRKSDLRKNFHAKFHKYHYFVLYFCLTHNYAEILNVFFMELETIRKKSWVDSKKCTLLSRLVMSLTIKSKVWVAFGSNNAQKGTVVLLAYNIFTRNLVSAIFIWTSILLSLQIPFFPIIKKDLTFLHLGNETYVDGLVSCVSIFSMVVSTSKNLV